MNTPVAVGRQFGDHRPDLRHKLLVGQWWPTDPLCGCPALEPIRALVLSATASYPALVVAQGLSGITGAVIGVLTIIVIADLTVGTGRFNLALGVLGTLSGIAASISTGVTGFIFQALGPRLGYLPLAVVAAAAKGLPWVFLSETKPKRYGD